MLDSSSSGKSGDCRSRSPASMMRAESVSKTSGRGFFARERFRRHFPMLRPCSAVTANSNSIQTSPLPSSRHSVNAKTSVYSRTVRLELRGELRVNVVSVYRDRTRRFTRVSAASFCDCDPLCPPETPSKQPPHFHHRGNAGSVAHVAGSETEWWHGGDPLARFLRGRGLGQEHDAASSLLEMRRAPIPDSATVW